jgi:hypothetical protein
MKTLKQALTEYMKDLTFIAKNNAKKANRDEAKKKLLVCKKILKGLK